LPERALLRIRSSVVLRVLGLLLCLLPTANAQTTTTTGTVTPTISIPHTNDSPKIDGILDDPCWKSATVITNFTQVSPNQGAAPTEKTEARLCYDQDNLYISIRCYDSEPDKILAKQMERDGVMLSDDYCDIVIDTFLDRRNGYIFQVCAGGAKRDGLIEAGGKVRIEWDGIWYSKVSIDKLGWVAEIAIPTKTISFNPAGDAWGFNIARTIRRKQELDRWATPNLNSDVRNLGDAGTIEGLHDLHQGHGLSFTPFLTSNFNLKSGDIDVKPSFDAYYKITPQITAALTLNTDFAEVEVDDRQVNLTRFPLFFPEKRPFFLEDAGIFSFGGLAHDPIPFFSRRIGIVEGQQKPILVGIKATGRAPEGSFGVMDIQMHNDKDLGAKNLSVVRGAYNLWDESSLGVIATHGDPATTGDNTLVGTDFNFRTAKLNGGRAFETHAWIMATEETGIHSDTSDDALNHSAFGGKIAYPNDDLWVSLFADQIGHDFNPALGFTDRIGVRNYDLYARYRWRPKGFINRVDLATNPTIYTDLHNRLQSNETTIPELEFEDTFGDVLNFQYEYDEEVLTETFEIHPGVIIPTGDYSFTRDSVELYSTAARPIALNGKFRTGDFYNGNRQDYIAGLEWRPSPSFYGLAEYDINDVKLPEGKFMVRILRFRANVLFSPEVTWSNLIQFDNVSRLLGINSRLRYEFTPGSEAFIVLNQGYDVDFADRFHTAFSQLTVKVGLTFRY